MSAPSATPAKPMVALRPTPRRTDRIFTPAALASLRDRFTMVDLEKDPCEEALG